MLKVKQDAVRWILKTRDLKVWNKFPAFVFAVDHFWAPAARGSLSAQQARPLSRGLRPDSNR